MTDPVLGYDPAQDGGDATGVTPPAGGWGIRGWLSGIYASLSGGSLGGGSSASIADSLVVDASGAYWYAVVTYASGTTTISYISLSAGTVGTPSGAVAPAATNKTLQLIETQYDAIAAGTGYSIGDAIMSVVILNTATSAVTAGAWVNLYTQAIITAPSFANITKSDQNVKITDSGTKITAAAIPTGGVGLTGWLSAIWYQLTQTISVSIAAPPAPTKQTPAAGSSFSIVTGGTAQTAFAANAIVTQGLIVNPKNATESLFIDLVNPAQNVQGGGTNGTSIELSPGQSFSCPPSTIAVSVNAATTGHTFIAVRF